MKFTPPYTIFSHECLTDEDARRECAALAPPVDEPSVQRFLAAVFGRFAAFTLFVLIGAGIVSMFVGTRLYTGLDALLVLVLFFGASSVMKRHRHHREQVRTFECEQHSYDLASVEDLRKLREWVAIYPEIQRACTQWLHAYKSIRVRDYDAFAQYVFIEAPIVERRVLLKALHDAATGDIAAAPLDHECLDFAAANHAMGEIPRPVAPSGIFRHILPGTLYRLAIATLFIVCVAGLFMFDQNAKSATVGEHLHFILMVALAALAWYARATEKGYGKAQRAYRDAMEDYENISQDDIKQLTEWCGQFPVIKATIAKWFREEKDIRERDMQPCRSYVNAEQPSVERRDILESLKTPRARIAHEPAEVAHD